MSCGKIIYFEYLFVFLGFVASHPTKPWDGVACSDISEDNGGCSKLDLLWVALGGNGRSRPFISKSLGMGRRCWQKDNAHQQSHTEVCTSLAVLTSLVERISHCTLFHNRKPTTLLPFSHNNFHSSRLRVAIVVCPGFPVGMPFQQQVLTPIRQHLWKSLMCVWHREQSKQDRRRRCASENGPRVIYSPAIPMNVTFFRKSIRNHYYGFCMSQKAS